MYPNLEAELSRRSLTRKDMANILGVSISTVSLKMQGKSSFTVEEAFKIKEKLFNNECSIEYLFSKNLY